MFRHIGATHRRRENSRAFQIEIPRIRGPEGAKVRRASALNQSRQDVGIVYGRIEHPIRAVIKDHSTRCATFGSNAGPETFRRGGCLLRDWGGATLYIPAATGSWDQTTIHAVCQAATGHEPTHNADGHEALNSDYPLHAHDGLLTVPQEYYSLRLRRGRTVSPKRTKNPEWPETKPDDWLLVID